MPYRGGAALFPTVLLTWLSEFAASPPLPMDTHHVATTPRSGVWNRSRVTLRTFAAAGIARNGVKIRFSSRLLSSASGVPEREPSSFAQSRTRVTSWQRSESWMRHHARNKI
jgi:hypothetical protein